MTRDNVPIQVNAVIWYRIVKPELSVIEVQKSKAVSRWPHHFAQRDRPATRWTTC